MNIHRPFSFYIALLATLATTAKVYAVCPLCTVAVAGGVVLAEKYGVDNTITGVWIGGLTVSLIAWTINWLNGRKIHFPAMESLVSLAYFLIIPVPLFWKDLIGNPDKTLWGIDKLLLGMIVGSVVFYLTVQAYEYLKAKNKGKAYFPFQRVVMPIGVLALFSIAFYFLTKG
ncbi:MAG: hypothetical protein Q7S37_00645 [bacterium]|nr:hypothetical protein [bacterium]